MRIVSDRGRHLTRRVTKPLIMCVLVITLILTACFMPRLQQVILPHAIADSALDYALTRLDDPYVWGGQRPGGFDCSGLIIWAYERAYPELRLRIGFRTVDDATQDELWSYNVVPIPPEEMQPGDVVFITSDADRMTHGGLFIRWVGEGEFEFVNASSHAERVVVDTWPVKGEKRGQWFAGAGRLQTVR